MCLCWIDSAGSSEIDRLTKALKQAREPYERAEAAKELAELGNRQAVGALIEALKDRAPSVRMAAADALGVLEDPRAIRPLMAALGDKSGGVRSSAAQALTMLEWKPANQRQKIAYLVAVSDFDVLVELGAAAFQPLLAMLKDEDNDIREEAARALGTLGDKRAIKPLAAAVADEEGDVREAAMEALLRLGEEGFKQVTDVLKNHKDELTRSRAAEVLGRSDDRRAVEPLKAALRDRNQSVRGWAALALDELEWRPTSDADRAWLLAADYRWEKVAKLGSAAVDALLVALKDEDSPGVRASAARALGQIADIRAVEPLVKTLRDYAPAAQKAAIEALGKIGPAGVPHLVQALKDKAFAVRDPLLGPDGKPVSTEMQMTLIFSMSDGQQLMPVRKAVASALVKIGPPAVDPLLAALKHADVEVRTLAAWSLGRLGDKRAVGLLAAALKDKDEQVRAAAAGALKGIADPGAVQALAEAMTDQASDVGDSAAEAMTALGPAAVQPLIAALKDKDPRVRARAAGALGELADQQAVAPLVAALKDDDERVPRLAAEALAKIGPPAAKPLIAALADSDAKLRMLAAEALGELRDMRAIKPMMALLIDSDRQVRMSAVRALDRMGWEPLTPAQKADYLIAQGAWDELTQLRPAPVERIAQELRAADPELRASAAGALRGLADPRGVTPLIAALKDPDADVRHAVAWALVEIGQPAIKPLADTLKDPDGRMRKAAAEVLQELKWQPADDEQRLRYLVAMQQWEQLAKLGAPAVPALIEALKDRRYLVRCAAARGLAKTGDKQAFEPIAALLGDEFDAVRAATAEILGELGDRRAVEPLLKALEDPLEPVRAAAVGSLGKLGDRRAHGPVIAALKDEDAYVRAAAAEALIALGDASAIAPLVGALADRRAGPKAARALGKLKWLPTTEAERVHNGLAKGERQKLLADWDKTKEVLLADVATGSRPAVENAVHGLLDLRKDEMAGELIRLLTGDGRRVLAEACRECGHEKLRQAAEQWLRKHRRKR